jgi:methyl-accepting chemotaxis protein
VHEETEATQEIARGVRDAAEGAAQVSDSISEVRTEAGYTGAASSQVYQLATSLLSESGRLKIEVERVSAEVRAA